MRTLKRLEIGQLNEFEKLSAEEQGMIFGGMSNNDGDCFWNCMEYCSKKYNPKKKDRHDYKYYGNSYGAGNATWPGTGSKDEGVGQGPRYADRNADGTYSANNKPCEYLESQFNVEGSGWTTGKAMSNYFGSNYDKNSVIIGTFDTKGKAVQVQGSKDETHAAIFTDYRDGYYYYHEANDPAKSEKRIKEEYVIGVAKVTGNKS